LINTNNIACYGATILLKSVQLPYLDGIMASHGENERRKQIKVQRKERPEEGKKEQK
jgi:hypothetical protein